MFRRPVARHQDDEAKVGLVLEEFLDEVIGVRLAVSPHCLDIGCEFPVFAFILSGRSSHTRNLDTDPALATGQKNVPSTMTSCRLLIR